MTNLEYGNMKQFHPALNPLEIPPALICHTSEVIATFFIPQTKNQISFILLKGQKRNPVFSDRGKHSIRKKKPGFLPHSNLFSCTQMFSINSYELSKHGQGFFLDHS